MPVSIVSIDVKDDAFKKFQANFEKYRSALDKMPGAWGKVNKVIGVADKEVGKLAANVGLAEKAADKMSRIWGAFGGAVDKANRSLIFTQRIMHGVEKSVASITFGLLKWGTLTSIGSGLLGLGGLWGLDRLASGVGSERRMAKGIGVSTAQRQAFEINYGRFFDTNSLLSGIAEAQLDPNKLGYFNTMGISGAQSKNPVQLAEEMAIKAKRVFEEGHQNMAYAQARGLTQFFSPEDLIRLHNTTEEEIRAQRRKLLQDQKIFELDDKASRQWQDLSTQFERSGNTIWRDFVGALTGSAKPIEHLSDSFTKLAHKFLTSENIGKWITSFSHGIEWLGDYLGGDKFQKDLESFGNKVLKLGTIFSAIADWLIEKGDKLGITNTITGAPPNPDHQFKFGEGLFKWMGPQWNIEHGYNPDGTFPARPSGSDTELEKANDFAGKEGRYGLFPGTLDEIWALESSRGKNLSVSPTGAMGHFQFMPGTAKDLGLKNPYDLGESSESAARYLAQLKQEFGGDLAKAVAAYNWGSGNLHKDIDANGDKWMEHLPPETTKYLTNFLEGLAQQGGGKIGGSSGQKVSVVIYNKTGAGVSVTANSAAYA